MRLTEILIDSAYAQKHGLFTPYDWHAFVWKFFTNETARNFLFRIDAINGGFRAYVLSGNPPMEIASGGVKMRTREIPPEFLGKERYFFKVRLNPVRVLRSEINGVRKKNGVRKAIPQSGIAAWVREKFAINGMRILSGDDGGVEPEISPIKMEYISRGKHAGAKVAYVDVSGALQIDDREKFIHAFYNGIGREKAFGFGMLIIK